MICPTCKRDCPDSFMTRHHLKTRKGDKHLIEMMCRDCHSTVHRLFTNNELRDENSDLNTVEGLLAHPDYVRAAKFISKLDPGRRKKPVTSNRKKSKSRRRR